MDWNLLIEEEARRRGLAIRTIETYQLCVTRFMRWIDKDQKSITKKDIKDFIDYLIKKDSSGSTINVYVNALKFFLEEVLAKKVLFKIKYSKTPKSLPVFLSKDEVRILISKILNVKHKLMVELMYSAGLRVSEVLNLKVEDIELNSKIGWVRNGKGNKDRIFIIAESLVQRIGGFIVLNCINGGYIFSGSDGKKLSSRTLHNVVKAAAKKARISKNVHCHTLRHSFATHLIENGYDVASVQSLLGHNSAKTTMVYVHVASPKLINVKSPYDGI